MDLTRLHLHWRTSQYQGKRYRSYSLARAYREQGKNRKEIVLKLGKLSDREAQRWRTLLAAVKKPDAFVSTLEELVVTDHYAYLDVAAANAMWDHWALDEVFAQQSKRTLASATVARLLSVNRCIDPATKSQTPDWFRHTALPWLLGVDVDRVNGSRIFRELTVIEQHKERLCQHLFERLSAEDPKTMAAVFYDLSSTVFTGSRCVLMRWGHCKEGYHNHVVLALVVTQKGLPFYWEVLPGGTADAKTLQWLLERLKARFQVTETTLVFDRGMVSQDNLRRLEEAQIKYISAMDRSQLETITGLDFNGFSHLAPDTVERQARHLAGFTRLNASTYYREIALGEGRRRYILCFNPELFQRQRKSRQQTVARFQAFVDELNDELRGAKRSRQRKPTQEKFQRQLLKAKLDSFVQVPLKRIRVQRPSGERIRSYQATVMVDQVGLQSAGRFDGFWLLVTNHIEQSNEVFDMMAEQAIAPYRDKVIIESAFRDIQSFVDVKPVHVWTEEHVKAHYTCCVLSHLINRTLTLRLHQQAGCLTQGIVAHEKCYKELSGCQIDRIEVENVGLSTYNMTRPTPAQQELLQRVGLTNLLASDVVNTARVDKRT